MEWMDLRHTVGTIFSLTLDLILKSRQNIFTMSSVGFNCQLAQIFYTWDSPDKPWLSQSRKQQEFIAEKEIDGSWWQKTTLWKKSLASVVLCQYFLFHADNLQDRDVEKQKAGDYF